MDLRGQNRELLNRIQSKDLHAFASLQANTGLQGIEDVNYPRTDQAEAKKLIEAYGSMEGFGEMLAPNEEEMELLEMLGANFSDNA